MCVCVSELMPHLDSDHASSGAPVIAAQKT